MATSKSYPSYCIGTRLSNRGDAYIRIRIHRNTSIALSGSLLLHALLLFFLSRQHLLDPGLPAPQPLPITVQLSRPALPPVAEPLPPSPVPPVESPPPQVKKPSIKPPPIARPKMPPRMPTVLATPEPRPQTLPVPSQAPPPEPPKPAALDPAQFADMAAYVNAMKERRHQAGQDADRINEEAIARERGPSEDEARMANLKRNLQPPGTSGVFQILGMDAHTARFAFRGWQNEFSFSHREVYEVDAATDGDVPRAVVRKMIEIIRRYYSGDFNWESPRFGRVIVLSARLKDNDGLEDFLLQEFFGPHGVAAR